MITLQNNTGRVLRGGSNKIYFSLPIGETLHITYEQFLDPFIQGLLNTSPASLIVTLWDEDNQYQPVIRNEGIEAEKVTYDNTESHLDADEIQEAVDILAEEDPSSSITFDNTNSSLVATNVQDALTELSPLVTLETSDETATEILNLDIAEGTSNMIKCQIQGINEEGTLKYNSDWIVAYDEDGLNDTPVGTVFLLGTAPTLGTYFEVSDGEFHVMITGKPATIIHWKLYYQLFVNTY